MSLIALVVSVCAVAFTVFSFWWLHVRRGKLVAIGPQYAFGQFNSGKIAIQLPIVLQNTGPRAIVVSALRLHFVDTSTEPLLWVGFSSDPLHGEFDFKKPVVIRGFDAAERIFYFQRENAQNLFEPKEVQVQGIWSGKHSWRVLTSFTMPASKGGWDQKFGGIDIVGAVVNRESAS